MAANRELTREEGGGRAEEDVDDEATFFSLELALITGHQSSTIDGHGEEKGKEDDGNNKRIDGREVAVATGGMVVGPAARLRALVRKLLKPKAAGPVRHPSGGRTPAAVEEGSRPFQGGGGAVSASPVVTAEERRRKSTEAALKYLSKVPMLACRRGLGDGPDDDTSPPPPPPPPSHRPQAPDAILLPGRKSRGEAGLRRLACKRSLGTARSSVSVAALPPPTPPRRDDSLLQAQDGVASAIEYCKLSLTG